MITNNAFPVRTTTNSGQVQKVATNVLISEFSNMFFVSVSQTGKIGSLVKTH